MLSFVLLAAIEWLSNSLAAVAVSIIALRAYGMVVMVCREGVKR